MNKSGLDLKGMLVVGLLLRLGLILCDDGNSAPCGDGEECIKPSSEWSKLGPIIAPEEDSKEYEAMVCDSNDVQLVVVKTPLEVLDGRVYLRVVIRASDIEEAECEAVRSALSSQLRSEESFNDLDAFAFVAYDQSLFCCDASFKKELIKGGLERFSERLGSMSGTDGKRPLGANGESIWDSRFLNSKMCVIVYGNIADEELEMVQDMVRKIRSEPERNLDISKKKTKMEALARRSSPSPDVYNMWGAWGDMVIPFGDIHTSCEENISKVMLLFMASWVCYDKPDLENPRLYGISPLFKDSIEEYGLDGVWATYLPCGDEYIHCNLRVGASKSKTGFKDYEEVLTALYESLKEARLSSQDEYDGVVDILRDQFNRGLLSSDWATAMNIISLGCIYFPPENYLNFFIDSYEKFNYEDVNILLEAMLDLDKWKVMVAYSPDTTDAKDIHPPIRLRDLTPDEKRRIRGLPPLEPLTEENSEKDDIGSSPEEQLTAVNPVAEAV